MRLAFLLVVTAILLVPIASTAGDSDSLPALIARLGSLKFAEREAASRALDAQGAAALPLLREACNAEDLEIRRRAEALVLRIEKRLETERLLEPKRVRLVFDALPVPEAIAEIKRQTGYGIQLGGDVNKLAQRKVTLDTGDCPFWEALQRFCAQAGLKENPAPAGNFQEERFSIVQNGAVMTRLMTTHAYAGNFSRGLTLYDGPPQAVPTCQCGAIRFRALRPPANAGGGLHALGQGFQLEVMPEPKLPWHGIVETRIDRAVDDQGQLRTHIGVASSPPSLEAEIRWLIETDFSRPLHPSQISVLFLPGDKPAARLREVKGQVTAQVQTPHETVLEIGNVLQSVGQTFTGGEEARIKVLEVSNPPKGVIKIRLQVEGPANAQAVWNAAGVMRANRRWNNPYGTPVPSSIWTLFDGQGRSYRRSGYDVVAQPNGNGLTHEIHLTFQPDASLGQPARLVETGRRTVLLEVPFVLTDIPL